MQNVIGLNEKKLKNIARNFFFLTTLAAVGTVAGLIYLGYSYANDHFKNK